MSNKIRVGIIGASPDRSWAATAHVPALRSLPQYTLTAVGTSRAQSARKAAAAFGAAHWFTSAHELAEHPDVDLVVIAVKVPFHYELAAAALQAGKHVLVEWPLGRTTEEAVRLAELARRAGVRHSVGLQARFAPAVNYARELIADGYIGRVTSVNVLAARGKGVGRTLPAWAGYTLNSDNAAGVLEVSGGHTLDALEHILGSRLAGVSARLSIQRPSYIIEETGETAVVSSPDQVLVHAVADTGAVVSVHIHNAKLTSGRTRLEFAGTEGDLVVETVGPQAPAGIQISDLRVHGSREPGGTYSELPVPDGFRYVPASLPADAVLNVAQLYARFATDIRSGQAATVPDFDAATHTHQLLDAIRSPRLLPPEVEPARG
jgi:predicted dehydrogenase